MSFFKKIFGWLDTGTVDTHADKYGISIKGIYKKPTGEIEIDFKVPSKKLFCLVVETDGFTKEKTIKFRQVSSYIFDKLLTWADSDDFIRLDIGLRNNNGQDLIVFSTYQKSLKFNKGDKIAFLFHDQEIKEYELLEKGIRIEQDSEGVIIESVAYIDQSDLEKFRSVRVDKWRHIPCDDRRPVTGTLDRQLQNDILEMTQVYMYVFENPI